MATYYPNTNNHIPMYMNFASSSTSYPNANGEFTSNLNESSIVQHDFNEEARNQTVVMNSSSDEFVDQQNFQGQGLSLSLASLNSQNHSHSHYNNPNCDMITQGSYSHGKFRVVLDPKYLKIVQELLEEVVHVKKSENKQISKQELIGNSKESDGEAGNGISAAEKQDLQDKISKLLSMLDEVERRYRQYYHQMQIMMSSFDVIAGSGAAKPYMSLALHTISRHFRSLRDAINGQIQIVQKSLGEQDSSADGKGIGLTRLRYVDQKLRQHRALQQLGMMQHGWRPQRGLPENSVSVLRAWLFEHFLHPYPKDSDKIMLANQTGLTRGQVSNWFINARVRVWKPMVEEMYKEEIGDAEMDPNPSHDNAPIAFKSDTREEEFQQNTTSQGTECCSPRNAPDLETVESETHQIFPNPTRVVPDNDHVDRRSFINDHSIFQDRFIAAEVDEYHHMSEMERFGSGNEVSLTLGLQHFVGGSSISMSGETQHGYFSLGNNDV